MYAPVTGFFSYDQGSTGLEATYNQQLAGTADSLFVRRLVDIVTGKQPEGASVQTTIVPNMQRAAYDRAGQRRRARSSR